MLKISSDLYIDIENIINIQNKLPNKALNIKQKDYISKGFINIGKDVLHEYINKILSKYEQKLHNYYKIKKKKERKEVFNNLVDRVFDFVSKEITPNKNINIESFIKDLHFLIFPNGIWGESTNASGQLFYMKYDSGKYRNNKELISVGGTSLYFTNPEEIEVAINTLINNFFSNNNLSQLNKIILFIFYFWKIHPFNDGNGTIAEILYISLMIQNGYKIIDLNFKEYFIDHKTGFFYDKDNINYYDLFNDYYNYLNVKKDS